MIIVDSRETKDIINKLSAKIEVEKDFLTIGDYLLPDDYAIECKRGADFMASVGNNRLFEQLNALYDYKNPVLCIVCDNIWKSFYFSKSRYIHKQYIGALTTITCKYPKLKVIFLESDDMFVGYIISLHNKLLNEGHSERPSVIMRKSKKISIRREDALTAAQRIGVTTAKKILKKFKTIDKVCKAKLEDLENVKGVSKKAAKNLYELLH